MTLKRFLSETLFGPPRLERTTAESEFFQSEISSFWAGLTPGGFSPRLTERVWVAERCLQMNAQAIATMPLRFHGTREPAWVANPDPVWFPNGIGDAVFAIVHSMYQWGDAFVYVTARYADGYPSAWTVLNAETITVEVAGGQRRYKSGQTPLASENVVQISRNPTGAVRGTPALKAYASYANSLLAAADLGRVMMGTSTPQAALKSQRKLTKEQAEALQSQWVTATSNRRGAPPVLPPDIDFETLSFSPKDMLLLDVQTYDAQVLATAYGLPASLINMPIEGGLNYQTPILLLEQWWRSELRTSAARIQGALNSNMLPAGSYVEFDPHEFLAPSFKELAETFALLVEKGIITVEQAQIAILHIRGEATEQLATPPSAGASPAQSPNGVAKLRPATAGV